ncbi:TPA: hypothetical protein ACF3DY_001307 [Klebsiella quasipneumoniae subsp. similipneumoniae]
MSTYALIKDGVVENIVVWDGTGDIFDGLVIIQLQDDLVGIGWLYADGKFTNPNEPQPPTTAELYEREMTKINDQYAIDKAALADAYLNAGLFDGPTDATKKAAIYAQLQTTNTKYYADLDALDEKYGV